ncbi:MAG: penicillin acylase family protein, partial [Ardenticatenaceae bacterium]
LPVEYRLLDVTWEPWQPMHSLAWAKIVQWSWSGDWAEELRRTRLLDRLNAETTALLLDEGATAGVKSALPVGSADLGVLAEPLDSVGVALSGRLEGLGSSWVVGPGRTESGGPILANAFQGGAQIPGIWYEIGLHAPGLNVVGASLPGIPAVIVGHNAYIAWGITNLRSDTQDLFVERLDPTSDAYEWHGEMIPLTMRREVIHVRGEASVVLEVRETRHGSLLNGVLEGLDAPVALQWHATAAPSQFFDAIHDLNFATNRTEFIEALRQWDSPPLDFVYADQEGNIGHVVAGEQPIRAPGGGAWPQPGWGGEWEWRGVVPFDELPQRWNPPEGYLVVAGQSIFRDGGQRTEAGNRRTAELIEGQAPLSLGEIEAIQGDLLSLAASELVPLLVTLPVDDIIVQRAQEQLTTWNYQVAGDLPGAGIYEVTYTFVVRVLLTDEFGEDEAGAQLLTDYLNGMHDHLSLVTRLLDKPNHALWDDGRTPERETRDDILQRALYEMSDWLGRRYGDVPHEWFWERPHTLVFDHPLGTREPFRRIFNRSLGIGGDGATLNAIDFSYDDFQVHDLPTYRQIVDVGAWENSLMLHTTGQS